MKNIFRITNIFLLSFACLRSLSQEIMYEIDYNQCASTVYSMGVCHNIFVLCDGYKTKDIMLRSDSADIIKTKRGDFIIRSLKHSEGLLNINVHDTNDNILNHFFVSSSFPPPPNVFIHNYFKYWRIVNAVELDSLEVFEKSEHHNSSTFLNYKVLRFEAYFYIDSQMVYQRNIVGSQFSDEDRRQFDKFTKSNKDFIIIKNIEVSLEDRGHFLYYTIPESRIQKYYSQ